jgi:prophage DNA circulation protein
VSDLISTARGLIPAPLNALFGAAGWRANIQPASFRGVPFGVMRASFESGRRVAQHEFPLRDTPFNEDLGRRVRSFDLEAYVLGNDYAAQRDALLKACIDEPGPGALIHPTLGEWQVLCDSVAVLEDSASGGMAMLRLGFTEAGAEDRPFTVAASQTGLLGTVGKVLGYARDAFALAYSTRNLGDFVQRGMVSMAAGLADRFAGQFLGLPGLDVQQIAYAINHMRGTDPTIAVPYALAVTGCFTAVVNTAGAVTLPASAASVAAGDAIGALADTSRAVGEGAAFGPGYALLAAGTAADGLAAWYYPGVLRDAHLANQAALSALVADAAAASAAQLSAYVGFSTLAEAAAARAALIPAIEARAEAAADSGADTLYAAWRAVLAAVIADDVARQPALPRLASYDVPGTLPALSLAHRLLGDARRADELVALNSAPHPAFMLSAGVYPLA